MDWCLHPNRSNKPKLLYSEVSLAFTDYLKDLSSAIKLTASEELIVSKRFQIGKMTCLVFDSK